MKSTLHSLTTGLSNLGLVVCFVLMQNIASAQSYNKNDQDKSSKMSEEHMNNTNDKHTMSMDETKNIDKWTEHLKTKLDLNEDQTKNVHDLFTDAHKDIHEIKSKYADNTSSTKKADYRKDISNRLDKLSDDLHGVMDTDAQKAKFEKVRSQIRKDVDKTWMATRVPSSKTNRGGDPDNDEQKQH